MTLFQWIGLFMLMAPFIALLLYIVKNDGWKVAIFIFLGTALLTGLIVCGSVLLFGS